MARARQRSIPAEHAAVIIVASAIAWGLFFEVIGTFVNHDETFTGILIGILFGIVVVALGDAIARSHSAE